MHERDQRAQVPDAERRSAAGQGDEGVGLLDVGPARRQRAQALLPRFVEEDPVLAPAVRVPDELVLLAAQRMEGMDDTESSSTIAVRCS